MADAQGAETGRPFGVAIGSLTALCFPMLLASLGTSIANVALPTLATDFQASFQQVQWIILSYLLAVTTSVVGAGKLGDMFGRQRLLLAGMAIFTAASLMAAMAPSLGALIAARFAQGTGAAIMMALSMALVGSSVPPDRTGQAMGLLGTTSAVGTLLGPAIGGLLIVKFGWPAIFWSTGSLGVIATLIGFRALVADGPSVAKSRERFDLGGLMLLAAALTAYALAVTIGRGDFGPVNLAMLLGSGILAAAFLRQEATAPRPLVSISMLAQPTLRAGLLMSLLVMTVMMTTLVVGPFYLSYSIGLDPMQIGIVMSIGPLAAALFGIPAGRLVDVLGGDRMTLSGLVMVTAGCVAIAASPTAFGLIAYLASIIAVTTGYALFQAANNTVVMTAIDPQQRGVVSGLLNLSRNLGLVTGAAVMGAIFAYSSGASDIAAASPGGVAIATRITFAVGAIVTLTAIITAASSPATKKWLPELDSNQRPSD